MHIGYVPLSLLQLHAVEGVLYTYIYPLAVQEPTPAVLGSAPAQETRTSKRGVGPGRWKSLASSISTSFERRLGLRAPVEWRRPQVGTTDASLDAAGAAQQKRAGGTAARVGSNITAASLRQTWENTVGPWPASR